jgi:hypothetical protein
MLALADYIEDTDWGDVQRVGVRRRNDLSPPPAITQQILGHGATTLNRKTQCPSIGFYRQQGNWITASSCAAMGNWGSQETIFHSAIAEFAILRDPILAYQPLRFRSRFKIVIMFMAFRPINRLRTIFFAIISLNTVLKVKNPNFS